MTHDIPTEVRILDSHTGGEPTRIVVTGGPELRGDTMADKRACFERYHDHFRRAVVNEPRGGHALVGGLICDPTNAAHTAGVIFFNNVGYLNMCGHGTLGLVVSLSFLGGIDPGEHKIETPVGTVTTWLHDDGQVTLRNVRSFRHRKDVPVQVDGYGEVRGDIAWGGNWFFLVSDHGQELSSNRIDSLTKFTWAIRQAIESAGITGAENGVIDHIELFGPGSSGNDSRNFVLCPGKAYDRSPCGTGTSAKLACMVEDGSIKPGDIWRQESIVGSVFEGSVDVVGDDIFPLIKGSAYVTSQARLLYDPDDPFRFGIAH
jgi:4-hydroxyproline epimerase